MRVVDDFASLRSVLRAIFIAYTFGCKTGRKDIRPVNTYITYLQKLSSGASGGKGSRVGTG